MIGMTNIDMLRLSVQALIREASTPEERLQAEFADRLTTVLSFQQEQLNWITQRLAEKL